MDLRYKVVFLYRDRLSIDKYKCFKIGKYVSNDRTDSLFILSYEKLWCKLMDIVKGK